MNSLSYNITFDNVTAADTNRYASELRDTLLDIVPDITVERKRENPATQDFGSALVLLLGTSSVTALAKALGSWLQLRRGVSLTIKTDKGEIIATHLSSKDTQQLAQLFLSRSQE